MATVTWDSGQTSKGQASEVSYTYTNTNFATQLNTIPPYAKINSVKITAKFKVNLYTNWGQLTVGSKTWKTAETNNHNWVTIVENEDITSYLTGGSGTENAGALPNITVYASKRSGFVRTFNTQVTITWDYSLPTCTAIFKNHDGTELARETFTYGTIPFYTGDPILPYVQDWQYANVFSGWSPALDAITGNTTYTAQFTPTLRKYVIERSNQNELAKEITISGFGVFNYGDTVTLTAELPLHTYVSWQIGADNVFKGSPLTFKLDDNTLSKLCGAYKNSLGNYETLESWIILNVSAYYKTYIVNFNESPENGGEIKQALYDDNGEIVYWLTEDAMEIQYPKNTLTIDAVPNKGYRFVKWSDEATDNPRNVIITEDVTFTAIFQKIPPKFTSAEMKYLDKQISASNKVIANEGFIIAVGIT